MGEETQTHTVRMEALQSWSEAEHKPRDAKSAGNLGKRGAWSGVAQTLLRTSRKNQLRPCRDFGLQASSTMSTSFAVLSHQVRRKTYTRKVCRCLLFTVTSLDPGRNTSTTEAFGSVTGWTNKALPEMWRRNKSWISLRSLKTSLIFFKKNF